MSKYIFILGASPSLSKQELLSFFGLKANKIEEIGSNIAICESNLKPAELMAILGGTVKIGDFLDTIDNLDELVPEKWGHYLTPSTSSKIFFGFSLYNARPEDYQPALRSALAFKKHLQSQKYSSRLVTGRALELSSVIVAKNHLLDHELLLIKHQDKWLVGLTRAVQDFEQYAVRDMERPRRDARSGMLPPKVARMMINLLGPDRSKTILDPFCGSGTILQEAMILGFKNILGRDLSSKAVADTQANLAWLGKTLLLKQSLDIKQGDVRVLNEQIKTPVDLIVTEPFMGDSRQIPSPEKIKDLQNLYQAAFKQFFKTLAKNGQVVFIFPIFNINNQKTATLDLTAISACGFKLKMPTIIYSRPDQKVMREITVWTKQGKSRSD